MHYFSKNVKVVSAIENKMSKGQMIGRVGERNHHSSTRSQVQAGPRVNLGSRLQACAPQGERDGTGSAFFISPRAARRERAPIRMWKTYVCVVPVGVLTCPFVTLLNYQYLLKAYRVPAHLYGEQERLSPCSMQLAFNGRHNE